MKDIVFKHSFNAMGKVEYLEAKNKILETEIESGYHYQNEVGLTYSKTNKQLTEQDLKFKRYMLESNNKYLKVLNMKEAPKEKSVEEMLESIDELPF